MHYYIDGYNLMFRLLGAFGTLQTERDQIILDLHKKSDTLDLDVTLVFDGRYRLGYGSRAHLQHLEICFTDEGETADEYILNELHATSNPRQEIVVTSDKRLACKARDYKAKTMTVEEFSAWIHKQLKKKEKQKIKEPAPQKKPAPEFSPPPVSEESFEYYLREFEKRFIEAVGRPSTDGNVDRPLSEFERWLKIFKERSETDK